MPLYAEVLVYPPETPLLGNNWEDLAKLDPNQATFVRTIGLIAYPGAKRLERVLAVADNELARMAEACDAEVVKHKWGIIRRNDSPLTRRFISNCVLESSDITLVAEVERIIPVEKPLHEIDQKLHSLTERYRRSNRARRLCDIYPHQFVYGVPFTNPQSRPRSIFSDIEPRFV